MLRRPLERRRLLDALDESAARTLLLRAPAGFGKTTLARQWTADRRGWVWVTLRQADRDVATLARDLADAFAAAAEASSESFDEFLAAVSSPTGDAQLVAATLADTIACSGVGGLVLDDYHLLVGAEGAEELIETVVDRTTLRLCLASRVRPTWVTARTILYGDVNELGAEELCLTDVEAAEILAGLPRTQVSEIQAQAEG